MNVLNASQMRDADRRTIEDYGVPSATLMERAGASVVDAIAKRWPLESIAPVVVVCGRGHNGGDGFVIARLLVRRSVSCRVLLVGVVASLTGEVQTMHARATAEGVVTDEIPDDGAWDRARPLLDSAGLVVDALFGTGARVPIEGLAATVIADLNARPRRVVAVDLPSGLSADTPDVRGPAVRATLTVTFAALKWPLTLPPAEELAGEVVVADIGIPDEAIDAVSGAAVSVLSRGEACRMLPPRQADSHKGSYGRVLIVAGSTGKTGAAYLSAMAALRSGAGLVTIATPSSCLPTLAGMGAEYMTLPLDEIGERLAARAADLITNENADVLAIGPGLGRSPEAAAVVRSAVARTTRPTIIDADAIMAFAENAHPLRRGGAPPIVITPHPGEMAHLTGRSTADVQADRIGAATSFAAASGAVVVLKGHRTLVASPDGRLAINATGNPGMATGGSGDVLTGVIAAWLGQGRDAFDAARLGVYLHGLAGDMAEAREGEVALIAGDIVAHLGLAMKMVTGRGAHLSARWLEPATPAPGPAS